MREIVSFMFLIGFAVIPNNCIGSEIKLTDFDLRAVRPLTKYLNSEHVLFVENNENVGLMKNIKNFAGREVFHAVVNTTILGQIFSGNANQWSFFHKRTAIVTKEELKLSPLLEKADSPQFLSWIVFRQHNFFKEPYIPVNSQVVFINSESGRISATQVYHLKPGLDETAKSLEVTRSADSKINFLPKPQKMNFENVRLDMLVLNQNEACKSVVGTLRKLERVHQEFLELMGKRLNFSINVVECLEKEHPFTYGNGSDSVLFLKLKHREVDVSAISHVIIMGGKRNYMEFVWPTFVLTSRMYLKQGLLTGQLFTYFRPLEGSVWWLILIWIIATGILIQIFEKALANKLKLNFYIILDFIPSVLKALQVFCNQGISDMSENYSIRIIYFCKFFVVLIFFQAYCGYLVSSLTVVTLRFPFTDLKGFFENRQYQMMTLQKGFHQYYIKNVIGEGQREDFMLPQHELPETVQQAVDKLCEERLLMFSEFKQDFLDFKKLNCRITELPTPVASLFVGIAMPKRTPLKEYLKREFLYLKSTGIVKRLGSRLASRSGYSDSSSGDDFTTVSMEQIFSVFILLWVGISQSVLVLIIELIVEKEKYSLIDLDKRLKFDKNTKTDLNCWREI